MTSPVPIAAALLVAASAAQGPAPGASARPGDPPGAPVPGYLVRRPVDEAPSSRGEAPILREGVVLSSARGFFAKSRREPGLLTFRLDERTAVSTRRALLVMPCDPADDVKAILDDPRPDSPSYFEVTGEVFECAGRAYLLPASVVALRSPDPPPMLARIAPTGLRRPDPSKPVPRAPRLDAFADADAPDDQAAPVRDAPPDRRAHEPDPALFPGLDDGLAIELERRLDQGIARSGTGTALKRAAARHDRSLLLPPATRLQERRATVLRDPVTGAWRARLDTGRQGEGTHDGAEISMELLPTLALERLERAVRQRPIGTTWLLSGEVVVARDRNYLLLTRAVPSPARRFESP